MNRNEHRISMYDYIKNNLKLKVITGIGFSKKIQLVLKDEVISEEDLGIFF